MHVGLMMGRMNPRSMCPHRASPHLEQGVRSIVSAPSVSIVQSHARSRHAIVHERRGTFAGNASSPLVSMSGDTA